MVSMKKLIFVFVFALLGTYFQSAQAQTFSRVVTVTKKLDSTANPNGIIYLTDSVLYSVPAGKVFKLEFFTGAYRVGPSNSPNHYPLYCKLNGVPIYSYKNRESTTYGTAHYNPSFLNESIWLKAGDVITIQGDIVTGGFNKLIINYFLSGIEYDAQ
jgi:hypothetical protein